MTWEGLNRRKFPRAKFPCLIKIYHDKAPAEVLLTHTENISSGGVCVIIKKHLEIFAPVSLELDLMDGSDTVPCQGKVVWTVRRKATDPVKPSFYDIGVEMVGIKDTDRARIEQTVERLVKAGRATLVK